MFRGFLGAVALVGGLIFASTVQAAVQVEGALQQELTNTCVLVRVNQIEQVVCKSSANTAWPFAKAKVGDTVRVEGDKDALTSVLTVQKGMVLKKGNGKVASADVVEVWQGTWLGVQGKAWEAPAMAEVLVDGTLRQVRVVQESILNSRFGLIALSDIADGDTVKIVAQKRAGEWVARIVHDKTLEVDQGSAIGTIEAVYLTPRPTLRFLSNSGREVYYFDQTQFLRGRSPQSLEQLVLPGWRVAIRGRILSSTELLATHVWLLN